MIFATIVGRPLDSVFVSTLTVGGFTSLTHERSVYGPASDLPAEQVAARVDGDVVAPRRQEDAARRADRVQEVGQAVPFTFTGIPAYPRTSFSSSEPRNHGWIGWFELSSAAIDAFSFGAGFTTTTPAFTACFVMSSE